MRPPALYPEYTMSKLLNTSELSLSSMRVCELRVCELRVTSQEPQVIVVYILARIALGHAGAPALVVTITAVSRDTRPSQAKSLKHIGFWHLGEVTNSKSETSTDSRLGYLYNK